MSRLPWLSLLVAGLIAGCADQVASTTTTASAPVHPRIPIQQFLPDSATPPGTPASPAPDAAAGVGAETGTEQVRLNDPSAPLDTPLCGRAQREEIATAVAISPDVMAGAGSCAATACFDPLTDTYIGADGARHVCQE